MPRLPRGALFAAAACLGIGAIAIALEARRRDIAGDPSFDSFRRDVAPILATTCSARDATGAYVCHGRTAEEFGRDVRARGYAPGMPHVAPTMMASACAASCHSKSVAMGFSFPLGPSGGLESERQVVLAFERARALARYDGATAFAKLLRTPLSAQAGGFGLFHGGGEVFESAADPEFRKLADWVALEGRSARAPAAPPGRAEAFFRDSVLPVFARNGCMAPSCHVFNHSSFVVDSGVPSEDLARPISERFTPEQVRFDRTTSLGLIQKLVELTGAPDESRILKKSIPVEKGGVLHRGGNGQFLAGREDPDYEALRTWIGLEREEAVAKARIDGNPVRDSEIGRLRGVVFVRAPTQNHRRYLDVGKYLPGADLWLLKLRDGETLETASGTAVNLTARFHPGREADVREPDVRFDGRAIAFAMRIGEEDSLNIYEISLDDALDVVEGSFRRLSFGPAEANGLRVHFTDPTYVPDPTDEDAATGGRNLERADLVFASNLAGEVVASAPRGVIGEADGGDRSTILDLDRPEPDGAFAGRRIYIVDGANKGEWRRIAAFENRLFAKELPRERERVEDARRGGAVAEGISRIRLDAPLPEPVDASTIYVIEREPAAEPGFLPAYAVYGVKYAPRPRADMPDAALFAETLTRITWGRGQELDLSVRSTGEVFYASQRSACDKYGRPIFHVASCRRHLDTRFSFPTHHGNRSETPIYADNHELPSGIDIHAGLDPDALWEGGTLIVSDHQFGPDLEARNPNDYATDVFDAEGRPKGLTPDATNAGFEGRGPAHPRFVFKTAALFPSSGPEAVTRAGRSPGGIYRDPTPLPDGGILVARAPGPVDHADPAARPDFDLFVLRGDPSLQPPGGKGVPRVRLARVAAASAPGTSDVQAAAIYARLKPKINAGRRPREEHLIRYPGTKPDRRPARYTERDYLLIDAIMRDPTPTGKHAAFERDPVTGVPTEAVDRVRFVRMVEALPTTPDLARPLDRARIRNGDPQSTVTSNGIHPRKRIVCEVPVEEDGSISVEVPSNTPLVIQSLNGDRMALRQEARLYFFAPNEPFTISPSRRESFQTCGACMGALSGRPQDLFGPTRPLSGQGLVRTMAEARGAVKPAGLAPEARAAIDFARDVQPILDRRCLPCHAGSSPAAGLRLSGERTAYYSESYESLHQLEDPASGWYGRKKYVSERDALAVESYVVEKVYGRELKAPRALAGDAPHPSPALLERSGLALGALTEEERLTLVRWIDLGAAFRGADDVNGGGAER